MKIVLDLQPAQGESRLRGIGRYSLSLAQAIVRNAGSEHEIHIALNHVFPEPTDTLRRLFLEQLPEEQVQVYRTLPGTMSRDPANYWRNQASQLVRENFFASLGADLVHTASMFEGWGDNCVVSSDRLPRDYIHAVTLYDLIPHAQPERYLLTPAHQAWYAEQLNSLRQCDVMLAISEYAKNSAVDLLATPAEDITTIFADADPMFVPADLESPAAKARLQQLGIHTPFIMYTGIISHQDPRKNCPGLVRAYGRLPESLRQRHQLVLVGRYNAYDRHDMLVEAQQLGIAEEQLVFTDRVEDEDLVLLYTACHLFVFPSLEEGFGLPALEAMRCGTVAIGSNNSSIPEVIGNSEALFDPLCTADMAAAIERSLTDETLRQSILASSQVASAQFSWDRSAQLALTAFEESFARRQGLSAASAGVQTSGTTPIEPGLLKALGSISPGQYDPQDLVFCAHALAENSPRKYPRKLLLDVSVMVEVDDLSGIQHVVRSLVVELTSQGIAGFEVELVYVDADGRFRVVDYQPGVFETLQRRDDDMLVDVSCRDVYLALDLHFPSVLIEPRNTFLRYHRQRGLEVYYLVYDLLPVLQAQYFVPEIQRIYPDWLAGIASQADGLLCISKAVADELQHWLRQNNPPRDNPLKIGYFHLGADIASSMPSKGLPAGAEQQLQRLAGRPSLLMVGTIEPRKGQQQVVDAMELLWQQGLEVNLVLLGKPGWQMEEFCKRLQGHPESERRLFWIQGASDEMLERVYDACAVLLSASTGEGFGLPLIEAAQHGLPILARDIPVFREVAGGNAEYFSGESAAELAQAIMEWHKRWLRGEATPSAALAWLSWRESAQQLLDLVLDEKPWYGSWQAEDGRTAATINS